MAEVTVTKGLIGEEDLSVGNGTFNRATSTGGTQAITKLSLETFSSIINAKNRGATGDGVTDDTTALQAALDAIDADGGGILWIPAGTYLLSSPGSVTYRGSSKAYCLKVPSNTTIIGAGKATILKIGTSVNATVLVNNTFAVGDTNIALYNFQIDGNDTNQTAALATADGICFDTVDGLVMDGLDMYHTAGYGYRLDTITNFTIGTLTATTRTSANRDGFKLIDSNTGVVNQLVISSADDSVSVTAWDADCHNIAFGRIVATSSLSRGFLLNLSDTSEGASTQRTIYSISAESILTRSCGAGAVVLLYAQFHKIRLTMTDEASVNGFRVWIASANVSGYLRDSIFDVVTRNNTEEGILVKDLSLGETATRNTLRATVLDPGNTKHSIRIGYGSYWDLHVTVQHDSTGLLTAATADVAVAFLGDDSKVTGMIDRGDYNLRVNGDRNYISGMVLTNSVQASALNIDVSSGATDNVFAYNILDTGINNAGTNTLSQLNVSRAVW